MNTDGESVRREYTVLYEQGSSSWAASVPDLPGCFAVGKTFEETETLIREAMELHIEQLSADGRPIPSRAARAGTIGSKDYAVIYEYSSPFWGASVPDLPGCFALGTSPEEAECRIREAAEAYIADLKAEGKPIPDPRTRVGTVPLPE